MMAYNDAELIKRTLEGEDGGNSWTQISTGLKHEAVRALAVSETDLYVGTFGGGVYRASLSK